MQPSSQVEKQIGDMSPCNMAQECLTSGSSVPTSDEITYEKQIELRLAKMASINEVETSLLPPNVARPRLPSNPLMKNSIGNYFELSSDIPPMPR